MQYVQPDSREFSNIPLSGMPNPFPGVNNEYFPIQPPAAKPTRTDPAMISQILNDAQDKGSLAKTLDYIVGQVNQILFLLSSAA